MNVSFPLRDGFFKPLQCSAEDERRWKQQMTDLLTVTLVEERPYYASKYSFVDGMQWKLMKERDQVKAYHARKSLLSRSAGSSQAVLAIGTIEGTLEDVVYGIHSVTTTDMRVTTRFLRDNAKDAAVLHVIENGTDEDPYRSLAVKWRVVDTPGGGFVTKRDGCVLEYVGIDVDAKGERYAFHLSENFDHPVCPPFKSKCAIRAKAHSRIIYRQLSRTRVGVFFKGDYDLGGKIASSFARRSAADMALGVARSVACTEAKKLTALALATSPVFHQHLGTFLSTRSTSCSICTNKPRYLSTKTMSWCKVCGASVCSTCRSRKFLFTDDKPIQISCCKQCLVAAKHINVDPTEPMRLISAGQWLSLLQSRSSAASWDGMGFAQSHGLSESRSYTIASLTSSSSPALSLDAFDSLLTPMSITTTEDNQAYDDNVAVLESSDMASVLEEEEYDDIPTLGGTRWEAGFRFNRKISVDDDVDPTPQFARSAITPAVAKSEAQAAIHREADRMSLYSQMRRLQEQAEDVYSMTQANGWEILGQKVSSSSASSMRSTAVMSTSSYASTYSHPSIG